MGKATVYLPAPTPDAAPRLAVVADQTLPDVAGLLQLAEQAGWHTSIQTTRRQPRLPSAPLVLVDGRRLPAEELTGLVRHWHGRQVLLALLLADDQLEHAADWLTLSSLRAVFIAPAEPEHLWRGLQAAWQGENWLPRRLLDRFLTDHRREQAGGNALLLTRREHEVLRLVATAATNAEIALALHLSEHTIKTHIYNLFRKLGVKNRVEAINRARLALPQATVDEAQ